jgi:hypothetical protein
MPAVGATSWIAPDSVRFGLMPGPGYEILSNGLVRIINGLDGTTPIVGLRVGYAVTIAGTTRTIASLNGVGASYTITPQGATLAGVGTSTPPVAVSGAGVGQYPDSLNQTVTFTDGSTWTIGAIAQLATNIVPLGGQRQVYMDLAGQL